MISKSTLDISKIIVCLFTGCLLVGIIALDSFGGVCGLMAVVRHTFRDKWSYFQYEYVGCNFGSAVPRKKLVLVKGLWLKFQLGHFVFLIPC